MRLNKYLSDAGVCSRREADRLVEDVKFRWTGKRLFSACRSRRDRRFG